MNSANGLAKITKQNGRTERTEKNTKTHGLILVISV